eukprot:m.67158 g.67158  ORF g.67158 m.67158 type:complete len:543 (-) comp8418_c0_seq2:135-1763(-)
MAFAPSGDDARGVGGGGGHRGASAAQDGDDVGRSAVVSREAILSTTPGALSRQSTPGPLSPSSVMAAAPEDVAQAVRDAVASPPASEVLAGWLYKLSTGRVKTYRWRWFVYDPYTGYLNYFKSKAPTAAACGYIDMAACRSIETTDPELKRFVINLPARQVTLLSSGPEETIYWMEELLERKSLLVQRSYDESKDEDFPDWEVIPTSALDAPGAVMGTQDGPLSPVMPPSQSRDGGVSTGSAGSVDHSSGMDGPTMRMAQQRLEAGEISQAEYDHLRQVLTRPPDNVASADAQRAAAYAAAHTGGGSDEASMGSNGDGSSRPVSTGSVSARTAAMLPTVADLTRKARTPPPPGGSGGMHAGDKASGGGGGQSAADVAETVRAAVTAAEEAMKARLEEQLMAAAEELKGRDEAIALLEKEVVDMDRELTLKDKAIELLRRQLRAEQDARREETRYGVTFSELQERLIKSQTELAHTKAVLDLQNHRIAAAMHQVTYYKSVVGGAAPSKTKEQALIFEQLVAQDQQLQVSEDMIHRLTHKPGSK